MINFLLPVILGTGLLLSVVINLNSRPLYSSDLDTVGVYCDMFRTNQSIKHNLVDNGFVDKIYSNITCSDISQLVQSGRVDIDKIAGLDGLKPWMKMLQNESEKKLILSLQK